MKFTYNILSNRVHRENGIARRTCYYIGTKVNESVKAFKRTSAPEKVTLIRFHQAYSSTTWDYCEFYVNGAWERHECIDIFG